MIEVSEVGVDFQDPIRLSQYHGADIDLARSTTQEWFVLQPCDNIVQAPGGNYSHSRGREIPAKSWFVEENEEAIRDG